MKRFLSSIARFAAFAAVAYIILIIVSGYTFPQWLKPNLNYRIGSYGHMYSRVQDLKNVHDIDILFLGSSHSYRGFDPRNFPNRKTFNLGSSAQTPIQTRLLLKRYLDILKPKTVVYEVYPATFSSDGVESSTDIIADDKNDRLSVQMALDVNHVKVYNTLLFGFFRDVFNLNKGFHEPVNKGLDTYIPGGYVMRQVRYLKVKDNYPKRTYEIKTFQIKAFEESIKAIQDRNIRLILVQAPIPSKIYNSYSNNEYYDSIMNSYSVPYYNFNKISTLNDSLDFYDENHLNQNGVNAFNSNLLEILDK